ncbi:DNRLRE domain-containing protein [Cytobacillus purgationiresistens]|uniref:RHS repeat-associated protein n=1 Tax=Cytobacillus purgationiresistens TaxID=863449 RepID=A0ABU0ALU0_9BACI|nr:DNRLRE domain-containing protein [Cytobacillus purgationiresistens]MDQ0271353.1 RHS repeat-associated protein [Cytobacillus purgationiresistens]
MWKKLFNSLLVFMLLFSTVDLQAFAEENNSEAETADKVANVPDEAEKVRELEELREPNTKTFVNSDGTYTTEIYTEDIHYEKDGELTTISNTPQVNKEADKNEFKFVNKDNRFKVKFAANTNKKNLLTLKLGKDKISYKLLGTENVKAKKEEGLIIYEDIFKHVDFEYSLGSSSVKEDIFLKDKSAEREFKFLITGDLTPKKEDRDINFYNQQGELVWMMPHPFMEDKDGKYSEEIKFSVEEAEDGHILTLKPDDSFLDAEDTVYPVRIDPTVNIGGAASKTLDTYVMKSYPNNNYHTTPELRSGYTPSTGTTRSYLDFSQSLPNLSGKILVKAELNLYKWNDIGSPIATKVYANRITKAWDSTKIRYNDQPSFNTDTSYGSIANTGNAKWLKMNLTDLVHGWMKGTYANHGVVLRSTSEGTAGSYQKYSASETASNKPYLAVTYSEAPAAPTATTFSNSNSTGYVDLAWNKVDGATGYKVLIYNGKAYEEFDVGNVTKWSTKGKKLWPTRTQIDNKQYGLRKNGDGRELPENPNDLYKRGGGDKPTSTNYWFRVSAYNKYGTTSQSGATTPSIPDKTKPTVPGGVQVTNDRVENFTIGWQPSSDLDGSGVAKYKVYIGDNPNTANIVNGAETTKEFYTVGNNLVPRKKYYAWVQAIDKSGNISNNSTAASKEARKEYDAQIESYYIPTESDIDKEAGEKLWFEVRNTGTATWKNSDNISLSITSSSPDKTAPTGFVGYLKTGEEIKPNGTKRFEIDWKPKKGVIGSYGIKAVVGKGADPVYINPPENIVDKKILVKDTQPPTGKVVINDDSKYTTNLDVTLKVTDVFDNANGEKFAQFANGQKDATADSLKFSESKKVAQSSESFGWKLDNREGTHYVYARFLDSSGNISKLYHDTIIYDQTIPSISIKNVANGDFFSGKRKIEGSITDNQGSLTYQIDYSLKNDESPNWKLVKKGTAAVTEGVLAEWDVSALPRGEYNLRISATDEAGQTNLEYRTIWVDTLDKDWYGIEGYFPTYSVPLLTGSGFVNLYNGSLNIQDIDFSLTSGGFTLSAGRSYASNRSAKGLLGSGWMTALEEKLDIQNSQVQYTDGDGTIHVFEKEANNQYRSPAGTSYSLTAVGSGFELDYKDGSLTKKVFDAAGKITKVTEPNGNAILYEYDQSALKKVASGKKSFTIQYGADNLISTITYSPGDKIGFTYQNGYLTDVKLTTKSGKANGHVKYEYKDGKMSAVVWENGLRTEFTFNGNRVANVKSAQSTRVIDKDYPIKKYDSIIDTLNYNLNQRKVYTSIHSIQPDKTSKNLSNVEYELNEHGNMAKQTLIRTYLENEDPDAANKDSNNITVATEYGNNLVKSSTDGLGNKTEYKYDSYGNITEQILPSVTVNGKSSVHSVKSQYNDKGQVTQTTDTQGKIKQWKYDSKGNTTESVDEEGNKQTFQYDGFGNVTKTTGERGPLYGYISDYSMEGKDLAHWTVTGTVKKSTAQAKSGKQSLELSANAAAHTEKVAIKKGRLPVLALIEGIAPAGNSTAEVKLQYLKNDSVVKEYTNSQALDAKWKKVKVSGAVPADATHVRVQVINKGGGTIFIDDLVMEESNIVTQYVYDADGENVVEMVDPYGSKTTYTYNEYGQPQTETNALNQAKTVTYDDKLQVQKVVDRAGREESFEYDLMGNLVKEKNSLGQQTTYEYNEWGQRVYTKLPAVTITHYKNESVDKVEDKQTQLYTEYDELGRVIKETDENGNVLAQEYDGYGRVARVIDPMQNQKYFAYDKNDNVLHTIDYAAKGIENTSNKVLIAKGEMYATYDEWNRQLTETDNTGNRNVLTMTNTYDSESRLVHTKDAEGTEFEYKYNDLGENTYTKDNSSPVVETWSYYDGLGTPAITISGSTIEYSVTDANGEVIESIDHKGTKTVFEFNEAGDKVKQINPDGNTTEWTYNKEGQILTEIEKAEDTAESTTHLVTTYEYNGAGEVVKQKLDGKVYDKASKKTTTHLLKESDLTYDELGRLIREQSKFYEGDGTTVKKSDVRFLYDLNGNLIKKWIYDESSHTINQSGDVTLPFVRSESKFEYDANNRFTLEEKIENKIITKKSYKDDENAETISSALGASVVYYNENDLEEKIVTPRNEQYLVTYTASEMKDMIKGPRLTVDMDYGTNEKMTRIQTKKKDSSNVIFSENYTYNGEEQITSAKNSFGGDKSYTYTKEGFLQTVKQGNDTLTYSYDVNGNLLKAVDQTGKVKVENEYSAGNRISTSVQYDVESQKYQKVAYKFRTDGSLEEETYHQKAATAADAKKAAVDTKKTYEYASINLLRSITTKKGSETIEKIEYTYDSEDNRTSKKVTNADGDRTELYYYDGNGDLVSISEKSGIDPVQNLINIYRDSSGQLLSFEYKQKSYDYVYNQRGDIVAITDEHQNVIAKYTYDEWGNILKAEGLTDIGEEVVKANPFRYVGKFGVQYDEDTKLYFMGWREYDAKIGRFLVADEYEGEDDNPISFNRYLYAESDPVNNIDPDGYAPKWLKKLGKGVKKAAKATYNFAVGDDIRTLKSKKTKWYQKAGAAISIASNFIPGGGIASKAIKAAVKGTSKAFKASKAVKKTTKVVKAPAKKVVAKINKKPKTVAAKPIRTSPKVESKAKVKVAASVKSAPKAKTKVAPKPSRGVTWTRVEKSDVTKDKKIVSSGSVDSSNIEPKPKLLMKLDLQLFAGKGKGKVDDFAKEPFLPDEAYGKNLPKFVEPGTKSLNKYDEFGNLKQTKYYDDYGREKGWVDFTNHGYPSNHSVPHWHEVQWNERYPIGGYKIDHRMDPNIPFK